ncbi:hypothetical protein HQ520_01680, partial [bacterium]|nr:hypothetical protein [bacterium]
PKTGDAGWAVQLFGSGGVIFRIGSGDNHSDILAPQAYEAGKPCRITCLFDRGEARIYADGKLLKTQDGIMQKTDDTTAAGRLGSTGETYQAVAGVISTDESSKAAEETSRAARTQNFVGTLREVRVYNRALSDQEARDLGPGNNGAAERTSDGNSKRQPYR